MRRWLLAVLGLGAGGILLMCLIGTVQAQVSGEEPKVYFLYDTFYPRSVMGTELLAVRALEYDGPFWEDGTNEQVSGVAALVVENQGGLMVTGGAVILEMGKDRMVFELSYLPPGATVLVLEKDRRPYCRESPVTCYGWTKEEYPEDPGLVSVGSTGLDSMTVTNHTGSTVAGVQVHYKNYDPATGMFLGGITYCVTQTDLMPREVRQLNPQNFSARESRIVQVLQEMDR